MALYGAIEAGGTKFVCAIAGGHDDILDTATFPTTTPEETMEAVCGYFEDYQQRTGQAFDSIGVACFGPIDMDKSSDKYGYITSTPKPGWQDTDVVGALNGRFGVPIGFDTDVNAAAYGEYLWGAGKDLGVVLYLTVGTGIGGGLCVNGKPLHGLLHPEMGHVIMQQDKTKDPFECACPFHESCLEGLASGKAVDLRWGVHASELGDDHEAWDLEADYLAQGIVDYVLTCSPHKIIIGGGLMHKEILYPKVRTKVKEKLNDYIKAPAILNDIDNYIVAPGLGTKSGISGAIGLAMEVIK